MKRVWKPLDIKGLRLYQVEMRFSNHPQWNDGLIVAARSPSHAAALIKRVYEDTQWVEEPHIKGYALKVYQPEE